MVDLPCQTVPELLAWRVRQSPQAIACHERTPHGRWRSYTWQEVAAQVAVTAAGLASMGVVGRSGAERPPIVAVLGRTSFTWWVIELATYHCGSVLAGLDPRLPHSQVLELLASIRPSLVFTDDEALARQLDTQYACGRATPRWLPETCGWPWFAWGTRYDWPWHADNATVGGNSDGPESAACTCAADAPLLSPLAAPQAVCDPQFDTATDACETESQPLVPLPQPAPHSHATLLFTSGTSGPPKHLLFRHEQLLLACRSICQAFPELGPADATLCWLPMAHLFQRVMNLAAIAVGGSVFFEPEPAQIVQSLREAEPTVFVGVPRFYERLHAGIEERLARAPWWQRWLVRYALARHSGRFCRPARRGLGGLLDRWLDRHVLAHLREAMGRRLRFAITGSAPTAVWLLEFFEQMGVLVLEAYGVSENAVPLATNRPRAFRFGSVGLPMPGNELRTSVDGEVEVRGPGLFAEYAHAEGQPPGFTPDGFYRTGDCGWFDDQGFLHLRGRLNEQIKVSTGRWLSPARIEQAYLHSPYVEQIIVFADGRQPPAALIYPSQAALRAAETQVQGATSAGDVRRLIETELARQSENLAPHERVQRFALLEHPLSVANGELTLLMKPRRTEIARRYADVLAQLGCASSPPADVAEVRVQ